MTEQTSTPNTPIKPICGIDDRLPPGPRFMYAVQHLFAMFSGNILCPILVANLIKAPVSEKAFLIQCSLFAAGLATIIQVYRFGPVGSKLPIVMGTSNAFIPTVMGIASRYGVGAVLATSFVGGVFETFLGSILPKIKQYFTDLVLGIVILTIGLTLIPVGINQFGGGNQDFGSLRNLLLAGATSITIIVCNQFFGGVTRSAAILFGMIVGYVIAWFMGMISFASVWEASWVSFPTPFQYSWSLPWDAVVAMLMMYVVTAAETMGDATGITMGGEGRPATFEETRGSVLADGIGSSVGAVFNAFPNTSYSQNVGVVTLTGVMSRHVVAVCAYILIIISLLPKLSAILALMPTPVLGGASIIMFSMVGSSGLVVLSAVPLNRRNLLIIAVSLGFSVGLNAKPSTLGILPDGLRLIFAETGVATATLVSILLDRILPQEK